MKRSREEQAPDFVSLKAVALVGETKATALKQKTNNITLMIPSRKVLAKAHVDTGKPVVSPTKTSRLPVPGLRERSNGQPRQVAEERVTKALAGKGGKKSLRGPIRKLSGALLRRVIDFLHDDPDALEACSLVHSTWTSPARYHLFKSLVFGGRPRYDTIHVALGPLPAFSVTATHNIRQLVLNFCNATHVPRLNVFDLAGGLALLPNLDDLVLAGLSLWVGPSLRAPQGSPRRIEQLVLNNMTLDPRELLRLLAVVAPRRGLSLGRDIRLRSKFWVDDVPPAALRQLEKASWRELAMGFYEGGKYDVVVGALRKTRMARRLGKLEVNQLWAPDVPAVQKVFADVGATLHTLALNLRECASTPGKPSFCSLYAVQRSRTLTPESRLGLGSGFGFDALQKLRHLRVDFGNPHMSHELFGFVMEELRAKPSALRSKLNLELRLGSQFIDQIGAWDEVLGAAKGWIGSVLLKVNDGKDWWDDEVGRDPTAEEWDVVREKMPLFCPSRLS